MSKPSLMTLILHVTLNNISEAYPVGHAVLVDNNSIRLLDLSLGMFVFL